LTDCRAFTPYIRSKVRYVDQLKDIIADYLPAQLERVKRGILDFRGDIYKFLFGPLTQYDAKRYAQHIQKLEDARTNEISHYVIQYYYAKSEEKLNNID